MHSEMFCESESYLGVDPIILRKCVPKNYSIDNNNILTMLLRGTFIPAESGAKMLEIYNL